MVTERAIINALIIGASFILVPFVISSSLTVDYAPVLFFGGIGAIIICFFYLKDSLSLCPLLGGSVIGSMNFLPLPLGATQIACLMLILYYVTGYVIIRQKKISLGKRELLWPIATITVILLIHNHSANFGALGGGGGTEGAKPAFLIYIVILAYFCAINLATPSLVFLSWVPLLMVILASISSVPFFLTTYIPSLAPLLYSVTDSVNVYAYLDTLSDAGGEDVGIGRMSVLGPIGSALQLYLVSKYPIGSWLRPERWWVGGLSLGCSALAVFSGYRNVLFSFALVTMIGAWCYYSWRAFFLPGAFLILSLVALIASSNGIIHLPVNKLPEIAQRTLSFLPGDWDQEALSSAQSSNTFRKGIQDVYLKEYVWNNPLIGSGYNINTQEFDYWNAQLLTTPGDKTYVQSKAFIEGKLFHTGWISLYDGVGIIGSAAFIFLGFIEAAIVFRFLFGPKADRRSSLYPLYVWLFCDIVSLMVSFFTVFGDWGQTFSSLVIYAIVLSHLMDIENTREVPIVLGERKKSLEFAGSKAGLYGYNGYNSKS